MNSTIRALGLLALLTTTACSFHSTATHWNGRVDADGKPVFVKTTTNIGINLLVILPILGNTTIDSMLDETTAQVANEGGDRVRVIQSGSENYWYGWSPFTWIITPVVTDVAVEYEPSPEEIEKVLAQHRHYEERLDQRKREDNRHVIPNSTGTVETAAPLKPDSATGGDGRR